MPIDAGTNDVIVADNDYIIRNILRSLLESKGFTVLSAIDGLEAVDYATRTIAWLVILDLIPIRQSADSRGWAIPESA